MGNPLISQQQVPASQPVKLSPQVQTAQQAAMPAPAYCYNEQSTFIPQAPVCQPVPVYSQPVCSPPVYCPPVQYCAPQPTCAPQQPTCAPQYCAPAQPTTCAPQQQVPTCQKPTTQQCTPSQTNLANTLQSLMSNPQLSQFFKAYPGVYQTLCQLLGALNPSYGKKGSYKGSKAAPQTLAPSKALPQKALPTKKATPTGKPVGGTLPTPGNGLPSGLPGATGGISTTPTTGPGSTTSGTGTTTGISGSGTVPVTGGGSTTGGSTPSGSDTSASPPASTPPTTGSTSPVPPPTVDSGLPPGVHVVGTIDGALTSISPLPLT